jgi:hypothetical protein
MATQNNSERQGEAIIRILTTVRKKMMVPQITGLLSTVGCEELSDWKLHSLLDGLALQGKVVKEVIPKEINGVTIKPAYWYVPGVDLREESEKEES